MNPIIVVAPPTVEPLDAEADAKPFLHLSGTDEDTLVAALIRGNREWAENITNRALCAQVREMVLDRWPRYPVQTWQQYADSPRSHCIVIECAPVTSVVSIKYKDTANVEYTWDSAEYLVALDSVPPRITPQYGRIYPATVLQPIGGIRVRFACGYSVSTDNEATQRANVPAQVRQTMLRRIRWQFDHRDSVSDQLEARGGAVVIPEAIELAFERELDDYVLRQF